MALLPHLHRAHAQARDTGEAHRASTPLELLFDLTFVVAIASAASQLHHGAMEGHVLRALVGYLTAFASIWFAWLNYSWFASGYDDDSAIFRVLTMVQMGGALVFATGVPGLFNGDFRAGVAGFCIMRAALLVQWLRAARNDPARRATCLRYAFAVVALQVCWVSMLWYPRAWLWPFMLLFMAFEMLAPPWAERPARTPWHAHHIAERFSLMVIITLGECVLGATNTVASLWQTAGWSLDLGLIGFASTLLVFCLWWMYFLLPAGDALHHHRERVLWVAHGHFFICAAAAGVGAGLDVVADVLKASQGHALAPNAVATHSATPLLAIGMVTAAEAVFMLSIWAVYFYATRARSHQLLLTLGCVALLGLGPLSLMAGAPMTVALLLLSVGPIVAIVYNELGRKRHAAHFAVR